jgi:hypothetical protein
MPKYLKICGGIFLLFIAFALGIVINDIPFVSLGTEVSISDLANLFLTIIVAIWIPISLSPLITDKRTLKDFLIEETKDLISIFARIKTSIDDAVLKGVSSIIESTRINSMISQDLSMKVNSLIEQLNLSFEKQSRELGKEIKQKYFDYWQETTSGALMNQKFKFDIQFKIFHDKSYSKFEACLKKAVHEINKY